jgi:hypothetical protein
MPSWPDEDRHRAAAKTMSEANGGIKVLTRMPPPPENTGPDLAGVYELICDVWSEPYIVLIPHPVTGVLVETHHAKRHVRGDLVSLNHAQASRLLAADAVAVPGAREARQRAELQRLLKAQQAELDTLERRSAEAQAVLSADLTDEQRALVELDLAQLTAGAGPSVAPTGPTL